MTCVAACSTLDLYSSPNQPPTGDAVRTAVRTVIAQAKLAGAIEQSPLRPAHRISPGDWLVCLRGNDPQPHTPYAVFFAQGKYVDTRAAVLIDGCDHDDYSPLAP